VTTLHFVNEGVKLVKMEATVSTEEKMSANFSQVQTRC
jgi:hypothetical protein